MPSRFTINTKEQREAIVEYLTNETLPSYLKNNSEIKSFKARMTNFILEDGYTLLYKGSRNKDAEYKTFICDYEIQRKNSIIIRHHNRAHFGIKKTFSLVNSLYYGIKVEDVADAIKNCVNCNVAEPMQTVNVHKSIVAKNIRDRYQIDLISLIGLTKENDGYNYIMNVIDCCSKYLWSVSLKDKTGKAVSEALDLIFKSDGAPIILHSDNGKKFRNEYVYNICGKFEVIRIYGYQDTRKHKAKLKESTRLSKDLFLEF